MIEASYLRKLLVSIQISPGFSPAKLDCSVRRYDKYNNYIEYILCVVMNLYEEVAGLAMREEGSA